MIEHIGNLEDADVIRTKLNALIDAVNAGEQTVSFNLSSANILAIGGGQNRLIVPAPGVGKMIRLLDIAETFTPGSYDYGGGDFVIHYVGNSQNWGEIVLAETDISTPSSLIQLAFDTYENLGLELRANGVINSGAILTHTLVDAGSDNNPGDTYLIEPAETANLVVDTVDGLGAVLTYHIVDLGGGGYVPGVTTTQSSITINILSINHQGDGTLSAKITYKVISK